jgi:hypothetical protein
MNQNPLINVLDKNFRMIGVIDDYISIVWAKRYSDMGDFVLELPISYAVNPIIRVDNSLIFPDTPGFMIIEDINPIVDDEGNAKLVLKGNSGEKFIFWRVTEEEELLEGNPNYLIQTLISKNILSPLNHRRSITYFTGVVHDTEPTTDEFEDIFEPTTIYEMVRDICIAFDWGFEMLLVPGPMLLLRLYSGIDRSFGQTDRSPIIFSTEMDNLRSSDYQISSSNEKNVITVLTRDDILTKFTFYREPEPSGRYRKETLLAAQDLYINYPKEPEPGEPPPPPPPPPDPDEIVMTPELMEEIAEYRGFRQLGEDRAIGIFDGTVDANGIYVYGQHYNLGDIVQFEIMGQYVRGRAVEFIRTVNDDGFIDNIAFDFTLDDIVLLWRDPS